MIEQIDDKLSQWVEGLSKDRTKPIKTSFARPSDAEDDLVVSLYLLEIADDARRHNTGRPQIQPSLRYLVTTQAGDTRSAHALLGKLFYAAMENPAYEVELDPVDVQLWSAFQIAPRPAFILRVPLPHEWTPPELPLVTEGADILTKPLATLYGRVLGPGDRALARARVEMPDLNRAAETGPDGRFTLSGVKLTPNKASLSITARGRQRFFVVEQTGSETAPVPFHFDIDGATVTLYGQVVGPGNRPLVQAQVELPDLHRSTITNAQGRFTLAAVPAAPEAKKLVIRAGGREQPFTRAETGEADAPVQFVFNPVG